MISLACPVCNHSLRIPDQYAGRQGCCKACGATISVPNVPNPSIIEHAGLEAVPPPVPKPIASPRDNSKTVLLVALVVMALVACASMAFAISKTLPASSKTAVESAAPAESPEVLVLRKKTLETDLKGAWLSLMIKAKENRGRFPEPSGWFGLSIDVGDSLRNGGVWYLGYATMTSEDGAALCATAATGNLHGETVKAGAVALHRLSIGVERFYITDINAPPKPGEYTSKIPVVVCSPYGYGDVGAVLYMDGHIDFIEYGSRYPMTQQFIETLSKSQ